MDIILTFVYHLASAQQATLEFLFAYFPLYTVALITCAVMLVISDIRERYLKWRRYFYLKKRAAMLERVMLDLIELEVMKITNKL